VEFNPTAQRARKSRGFSLIEMMVALSLVGILGVVAGGFLLPLRLNGTSAKESQALTYAKSYLEITKNRWLDINEYRKGKEGLPVVRKVGQTTTPYDLEIPSDWTMEVSEVLANTWLDGDQIRNISVTFKAPSQPDLKLSTQISRPSYEN
jgi:prepilin-type N-terminal cleavage/methylation domain-containing protein